MPTYRRQTYYHHKYAAVPIDLCAGVLERVFLESLSPRAQALGYADPS